MSLLHTKIWKITGYSVIDADEDGEEERKKEIYNVAAIRAEDAISTLRLYLNDKRIEVRSVRFICDVLI
jgi:hypothetical protein